MTASERAALGRGARLQRGGMASTAKPVGVGPRRAGVRGRGWVGAGAPWPSLLSPGPDGPGGRRACEALAEHAEPPPLPPGLLEAPPGAGGSPLP